MKALVLYHPDSDHARSVLTFKGDLERLSTSTLELVSLETKEGAEKAKVYGITRYPAILVTTESGEMLKFWEGEVLPTINEVVSYLV